MGRKRARTGSRGARSTVARRSSRKGAEWERACCRRLSLWVSGVSRKDLFWRTAMSGGRSTLARAAGEGEKSAMHSGDLSGTHEDGLRFLRTFSVECKHVHDAQWHLAVYRGTGKLVEFWAQTREQAPLGRLPMLLLKEDRRGELVGVDSIGLRLLRLGIRRWSGVPVVARVPPLDLHLVHLRDFLVRCSWSDVLRRRARYVLGR